MLDAQRTLFYNPRLDAGQIAALVQSICPIPRPGDPSRLVAYLIISGTPMKTKPGNSLKTHLSALVVSYEHPRPISLRDQAHLLVSQQISIFGSIDLVYSGTPSNGGVSRPATPPGARTRPGHRRREGRQLLLRQNEREVCLDLSSLS